MQAQEAGKFLGLPAALVAKTEKGGSPVVKEDAEIWEGLARMWMKQVFLGFIGLASGAAISAGVFSFIISIGVVPRIIGKSRTAFDIMAYENAVLLGGTVGNLMALFPIKVPLGIGIVILFGLSAGIFTGCLSVALAEILNTFPIMFRRFGIKEGLSWMLFFMALGKAAGALYFYINHMQKM